VSRRTWSVLIAACLCLIGGAVVVHAGDGRVNPTTHFGGDALFCVDRNLNVSANWWDEGEGGMLLLNENGQQLWLAPAVDIKAAADAALAAPGTSQFIGSGDGTYGTASLSVYYDAGSETYFFTLAGYDEFGKPNALTFASCQLQTTFPAAPPTATPDPCEEVRKRLASAISGRIDPCCEAFVKWVAGRIRGLVDPCCVEYSKPFGNAWGDPCLDRIMPQPGDRRIALMVR